MTTVRAPSFTLEDIYYFMEFRCLIDESCGYGSGQAVRPSGQHTGKDKRHCRLLVNVLTADKEKKFN